jgi:hypothetical protein
MLLDPLLHHINSRSKNMALYMTQKMSSGILRATTYYRKSSDHPSHQESSTFTINAKQAYANKHMIATSSVEEGTYKSGQGVPTGGNTEEI